ncbi:MAG: hemerythrin domain-containing protein [bacterium]
MKEHLNKGVKEIITEFPEVAEILNEYSIGCVPCSVGSCLLKDIVAIHNLPEDVKQELMYRIEKAIYPDRDVKIPVLERKEEPLSPEKINYSPPIKKLVEEHMLIKRWIELIPKLVENLDIESDKQLFLGGVDFIRSYADKFHHAKEENILFKYVDENLDITKTMLEDHTAARNHVKAIIEGLERQDEEVVFEHLNAYKELLTEHIKKEDEILYPWIDRSLSIRQVGELFTKFNQADKKVGEMVPEKYEKFIAKLEQITFKQKEVKR